MQNEESFDELYIFRWAATQTAQQERKGKEEGLGGEGVNNGQENAVLRSWREYEMGCNDNCLNAFDKMKVKVRSVSKVK